MVLRRVRLTHVQLAWDTSCRLVASRYPAVGLFDAVADPADLDVVFAVEALGNPRLRQEQGALSLLPQDQRISGPGTTPIMSAFTHLNPEGSRFSDGTWGVYYAANDLDTAVAEVSHHRARFLARTAEAAIEIDLRCYRVPVRARLLDLRGRRAPAGHPRSGQLRGFATLRAHAARRERAGHRPRQRAASRWPMRRAVHPEGDRAARAAGRARRPVLER